MSGIVDRVTQARPVRVLVVDDHPAVRAGVTALVDAEPGLVAVDAVGDAFAVAPAIHAQRPKVVVLDYQLPGLDGLSVCRQIRRGLLAPCVVIYSAFAGRELLVAAHLAGAGAVVDKTAEPRELTLLIRRLAAGERLLAPVTGDLVEAAAHRLHSEDRPLLRRLLGGEPSARIAEAAGLAVAELDERVDRMLARLVVARSAV